MQREIQPTGKYNTTGKSTVFIWEPEGPILESNCHSFNDNIISDKD